MLMATLHELARAFGHFTSFQIHYRVNLVITTTSVILGFSLVHIHTRTVISHFVTFLWRSWVLKPQPYNPDTHIYIQTENKKCSYLLFTRNSPGLSLCCTEIFYFLFLLQFFSLWIFGGIRTIVDCNCFVNSLFFIFFDYSISVNNFLAMVQGLGM